MGNTNIIDIQTDVSNNFLNDVNQNCIATCKGSISRNSIIIDDSDIAGGINIFEKCTANASCVMANQSISTADTIISNTANQENDIVKGITDFMNIFNNNYNDINIRNAVTNNITNITNQTCQANSINDIDDNFIYARNSNITGGINLYSNQGSAKATCTMKNLSKIQSYVQIQNDASQTNREIGPLAFIAAIIVLAIFGGSILYYSMYGGKKK